MHKIASLTAHQHTRVARGVVDVALQTRLAVIIGGYLDVRDDGRKGAQRGAGTVEIPQAGRVSRMRTSSARSRHTVTFNHTLDRLHPGKHDFHDPSQLWVSECRTETPC